MPVQITTRLISVVGPQLDCRRAAFGIVPQQTVEARIRTEFLDFGNDALMAQQRLRRHQNQRLAEIAMQLPPQNMEIIRGRRAVGDLPIIFRRELKIAFQAGGRVLWSLTFIAMR